MERHEIIELAFRGASAHYEIPWQEIKSTNAGAKEAKQMAAFAMYPYLTREEIAEILEVSYSTVQIYIPQAKKIYECYGSFYNSVRHIRQQYRLLKTKCSLRYESRNLSRHI